MIGKGHLRGGVTLSLVARLPRGEFIKRLGDNGKIGARLCVVEANQDIAGLDPIAVAHTHFADHPASGMLNLLDVGLHHQDTASHHGPTDLHRGRPAPDAKGKDPSDDSAAQEGAPHGSGGLACRRHHVPVPKAAG